MFLASTCQMRPFTTQRRAGVSPVEAIGVALCLSSLHVGVLVATSPAVAQPLPQGELRVPTPPLSDPTSSAQVGSEGVGQSPNPQLSRYRLGPGDAISVVVQRFGDLSFQALINPEGNIAVPLLGTVSLEGLTLEEAQEKIRLGLNRFVIDPIVALSLVGQRPVQVTITGEVTRPGIYPIASATPRISEALQVAGGTTMTADLRAVQVRRTLIDGSVIEQSIDLFTPLQNGGAFPNLRLQDGDAVIVPKREVGTDEGYDRALVARSTLAQQQINIRVLSYANGAVGNIRLANGSTFVDALTAIAPNPDTTKLREIALIRFDPERGKAITQKLNGKAALRGDASQNVPLQDNDVIVVGRNLIGQITNAISTITRPFRDVFGFLLFFDELSDNRRYRR